MSNHWLVRVGNEKILKIYNHYKNFKYYAEPKIFNN